MIIIITLSLLRPRLRLFNLIFAQISTGCWLWFDVVHVDDYIKAIESSTSGLLIVRGTLTSFLLLLSSGSSDVDVPCSRCPNELLVT